MIRGWTLFHYRSLVVVFRVVDDMVTSTARVATWRVHTGRVTATGMRYAVSVLTDWRRALS